MLQVFPTGSDLIKEPHRLGLRWLYPDNSLVCITLTSVWSLSVLVVPAESQPKGRFYLLTLQKCGQMLVTDLYQAGAAG